VGRFAYHKIGSYTKRALLFYLLERERPDPGDFLEAVLCNNLKEAVGRADDTNLPALPSLVGWLYNFAPSSAWGSPEKVTSWLRGTTTPPPPMAEDIQKLGQIAEFTKGELDTLFKKHNINLRLKVTLGNVDGPVDYEFMEGK
jgi:hypothetical protein